MPNPFTSQVKIVPDQEQQHISIGLESLSQNLSKIQTMKDLDDQAKMDQFNKLADISLEGFWQRDKDELFLGEQTYLDNVAKAYKDAKEEGSEGMLPYRYQAKLDKEKSELMALLEQSKSDAEWYKSYMKQVAYNPNKEIDTEASIAPVEAWMKMSIEERAKVDKTGWMKRKKEEINLQTEIGDMANDYLNKSESVKIIRDDDGNIDYTRTWEAVSDKDMDAFAENVMRNDRLAPLLKAKWKDPDTQTKYKTYKDFVKAYIPGMGSKSSIDWSKGGKGEGDSSRYDPNANNQYDYFPTTDTIPRTPGNPSSIEIKATSTTSVPVGIPYTQKGKKMTIESVKVMPSVKDNVTVTPPGMPSITQKKGDIIGDDELQYYEGNIEQKSYVVVSYIKEETVRKKPGDTYDTSTKVVKTKVYETVPYDDDIKAYLIKSKKFGEKLDVYVNGVVNQPSGGTPNDGLY